MSFSFSTCSEKCDLWVTTGLAVSKAPPQGCTEVSGHTESVDALIQLDQLTIGWSWSLAEGGTRGRGGRRSKPKACVQGPFGLDASEHLTLVIFTRLPTKLNERPKAAVLLQGCQESTQLQATNSFEEHP